VCSLRFDEGTDTLSFVSGEEVVHEMSTYPFLRLVQRKCSTGLPPVRRTLYKVGVRIPRKGGGPGAGTNHRTTRQNSSGKPSSSTAPWGRSIPKRWQKELGMASESLRRLDQAARD
jgi:hypothetical protein